MRKTQNNYGLVTDKAKVTVSDGLYAFDWRSLFRAGCTQKPVTNRHPSLIDKKPKTAIASPCTRAA